jgi:hypothetical protein
MLVDPPDGYVQELVEARKGGRASGLVDVVVKGRLGNSFWYTNLDHDKRQKELILYKEYSPEDYPRCDNNYAIGVSRVSDVPEDYDGLTGGRSRS